MLQEIIFGHKIFFWICIKHAALFITLCNTENILENTCISFSCIKSGKNFINVIESIFNICWRLVLISPLNWNTPFKSLLTTVSEFCHLKEETQKLFLDYCLVTCVEITLHNVILLWKSAFCVENLYLCLNILIKTFNLQFIHHFIWN